MNDAGSLLALAASLIFFGLTGNALIPFAICSAVLLLRVAKS